MKKFLIFLLFISAFISKSFGTIQGGDLLIIENDTILIHQFPLDQFYKKGYSHDPGYFLGFHSTACWRGYKAVWIIKNNRLYLRNIYDCYFEKSVLIAIIGKEPTENSLIFADWFSGSFSINMKEKREIVENWNLGHLFVRKKKIKILNGILY